MKISMKLLKMLKSDDLNLFVHGMAIGFCAGIIFSIVVFLVEGA